MNLSFLHHNLLENKLGFAEKTELTCDLKKILIVPHKKPINKK